MEPIAESELKAEVIQELSSLREHPNPEQVLPSAAAIVAKERQRIARVLSIAIGARLRKRLWGQKRRRNNYRRGGYRRRPFSYRRRRRY